MNSHVKNGSTAPELLITFPLIVVEEVIPNIPLRLKPNKNPFLKIQASEVRTKTNAIKKTFLNSKNKSLFRKILTIKRDATIGIRTRPKTLVKNARAIRRPEKKAHLYNFPSVKDL
jgi:hypothetical protein